MTRPSSQRRHLAGVGWQQMKFVADPFRLWINDYIHVACTQAPATPHKTERKLGGQFKAADQNVTTGRKQLFDSLFGSCSMWHISKISQRALVIPLFPSCPYFFVACLSRSARFNYNRERRQNALCITKSHNDGGRLARKNVIGKSGRNNQVAKRDSCGNPGNKQCRAK